MSISQELVDKIIELREQNLGYREIMKHVGLCNTTVRNCVLKHRPDLRLVMKGKNPPRNQAVIDRIVSLKEQGFRQSVIADDVNLTRERVRQLVNKHCPSLSGREYLFLSY